MAGACRPAEMLLAVERHEVCKMAQIHALMIDHVYQTVGPVTLTQPAATAILLLVFCEPVRLPTRVPSERSGTHAQGEGKVDDPARP